jgi:soluble lytic murein transglycosylase
MVALQKVGRDAEYSWQAPPLTENLTEALKQSPSGLRALALLDVGRKDLAVKEFKQIHPNGKHRLEKALIAAANHYNLPELAMRLGNALGQPDGKLYDVALYPVVPWKGEASTGVDPALINALIRQESKFDAGARNSRSGAQGLMQLMPRTARFVSDGKYKASDVHKPQVNIVLGQRYIRHLLDLPSIKGNLLYLAAAYNAGPGNLNRWQKNVTYGDDPFLFIESIPLSETRAFVERVMTNFWIYRERMGMEATTLNALTQDQWPVYEQPGGVEVASLTN